MTCTNCTKRNHASFTPFLGPQGYRPCMDDYEVCGAMHRDIEGYNDDFDDIVEYLLDDANMLDYEDKEAIITIQLMLAGFVECIYNLQRELSRVRATEEELLGPGAIYYHKDRQDKFDSLCQEFEVKATALYNFRRRIAAAPGSELCGVDVSARDWKALIRELQQGVSNEYLLFPRR